MKCRIVTPGGLYKETECSILNIRTIDGQRGILSNHMPLVTMLEIGEMNFVTDKGREEFAVAGGMFYDILLFFYFLVPFNSLRSKVLQ